MWRHLIYYMYFLSSMRGDFLLSSANLPLNEPLNVPFKAHLNEIPTWRGLLSLIRVVSNKSVSLCSYFSRRSQSVLYDGGLSKQEKHLPSTIGFYWFFPRRWIIANAFSLEYCVKYVFELVINRVLAPLKFS